MVLIGGENYYRGDIMKVKELIKELNKMPQEMEVKSEDMVIGNLSPIHSVVKGSKYIILTWE